MTLTLKVYVNGATNIQVTKTRATSSEVLKRGM